MREGYDEDVDTMGTGIWGEQEVEGFPKKKTSTGGQGEQRRIERKQ